MNGEGKKTDALAMVRTDTLPDAANLRVLATDLLNSEFFKSVVKVPQAVAVILYGQEIGLSPIVALQTIKPVNGQMCVATTVLQALFQRRGGKVKVLERSDERARVELSRPGWDPYIHEYTQQDAKDEQLWEKDNWKKRKKTMLLYRAISGGIRVYDPTAFLGLMTSEEVADYPGGFPIDAEIVPGPSPEPEKGPKKGPGRAKAEKPAPQASPAPEASQEAPQGPKEDEKKPAQEPPPAAKEPEKGGFEVDEPEDDGFGEAVTSKTASEEDEIVEKIKSELTKAGVDAKAFKAWLIGHQDKMKPNKATGKPRRFVVKLGHSIRFHGGESEDHKFLLEGIEGAIGLFRYHTGPKAE